MFLVLSQRNNKVKGKLRRKRRAPRSNVIYLIQGGRQKSMTDKASNLNLAN